MKGITVTDTINSADITFDEVAPFVIDDDAVTPPEETEAPGTPEFPETIDDDGNIVFKGEVFPTKPRILDYIDISTTVQPRVDRKWFRYKSGGVEFDMFYRGLCPSCGYSLWTTDDEEISLSNYLSNENVGVEITAEDGTLMRTDHYCKGVPSRQRTVVASHQRTLSVDPSVNVGFIEWPESIMGPRAEIMARKYAETLKWTEPDPVVPVHGAFVAVRSRNIADNKVKWDRFDRFTGSGKIRVVGSTEKFEPSDVLVATAAMYGAKHSNAVVLPIGGSSASYHGLTGRVMRWEGRNVRLRVDTSDTETTFTANSIAVLVPPLNPATEKAEDKAARMERELRRLQEVMHRRMVAEGVARQWCSEFDPILDSTGLAPRQPKMILRGTMSFEVSLDAISDETVESLRTGEMAWSSHIPNAAITVTQIEGIRPGAMPALS